MDYTEWRAIKDLWPRLCSSKIEIYLWQGIDVTFSLLEAIVFAFAASADHDLRLLWNKHNYYQNKNFSDKSLEKAIFTRFFDENVMDRKSSFFEIWTTKMLNVILRVKKIFVVFMLKCLYQHRHFALFTNYFEPWLF